MTPVKQTAFRIPSELLEALQLIKERDGVPISEQVRRALTTWVEAKGVVKVKTAKRSAATPRKA